MRSRTMVVVAATAMVVLALLVGAGSAVADPPQTEPGQQDSIQRAGTVASKISYQGRLTGAGGDPLSGSYDLVFQLWDDAAAGSQVGSDIVKNGVPVSNGLFSVELDVPQSTFDGQALWLRIRVGRDWLSPRQQLLPAPYALSLRPGAVVQGSAEFGSVVEADNTATGGFAYGMWGTSAGGLGSAGVIGDSMGDYAAGVMGRALATSTTTSGVWGESRSPDGRGVAGYASATSGATYGVYGESDSPDGRGVAGYGTATDGPAYGVYGQSYSSGGVGVYATGPWRGVVGYATATSGANIGVYGESASGSGTGVTGANTSSGTGVTGTSSNGDGVRGQSSGANKSGVYGANTGSGFGVYGSSNSGYAGGFRGNVAVFSRSTGAAILELGEGLDYAEGFDLSDQGEILPGTVLVIDPDQPGKLTVSNAPYDRKVAGIVAGARGLGSGVRLGVDQYDHDVALAGRVYCNVDAGYGEVSPGDLLTTSPTAGYAMVVRDFEQAQGAILGKAMEGLAAGQRGQILVLVTLQ